MTLEAALAACVLLLCVLIFTCGAAFALVWVGRLLREAVMMSRIRRLVRAQRAATSSVTAAEAAVRAVMGLEGIVSGEEAQRVELIRAEIADQFGGVE